MRSHAYSSAGGVVVWSIDSTAKVVSACRSRRAADPDRSRAFPPNRLSRPVNEGAAAGLVTEKTSSRGQSRPKCRSLHPYEPSRHNGNVGSTRSGHRASIPPYGDGTSPTVPDRGPRRPRVSGATSSRVRIGSYLLRIYPYPAHGGLGPVGGGSRGRREAVGDPLPSKKGVGG